MDERESPAPQKRKKKIKEEERTDSEIKEFMKRVPFTLYDGQKALIEDAYRIIQSNGIGSFESPTGTGKTRSILLTAMKYTEDTHMPLDGVSAENISLLRDLYNRSTKHFVYACRTHSQIDQVISELEYLNKKMNMSIKGVVLGSRAQTCINHKVNSSQDINNLCRLLTKERKCVYYNNLAEAPKKEADKTEISIEKALEIGKKHSICPYFYLKGQAARSSVIVLPYSILLKKNFFKETRINKTETVIVIDEAHNLYDAVLDEHAVSVKYASISKMIQEYEIYMSKTEGMYKTELLEVYIAIEGITQYISEHIKGNKRNKNDNNDNNDNRHIDKEKSRIINVNKFLVECKIDSINLLDISEIVEKYSLASRIFPMRNNNVQNENENTLRLISKLFRLLGECEKNSYLVLSNEDVSFRNIYPAKYLTHLEGTKSILLAGGTLHPSKEMDLLFEKEVAKYSYPAVCTNIKVFVCTDYLFTYREREDSLTEAYYLAEKCLDRIESGGVLVFVQSKGAIAKIKETIDKIRSKSNRIGEITDIMFEGDIVIDQYKKQIEEKRKGIMFCVMGGHFSEGINFDGELCRVLIICGIPLPLPSDEVVLIGKHRGIEHFIERGMRTVNQTIGRAVRSVGDYSCVILLDKRFAKHKEKLSPWMGQYISITESRYALDEAISQLKIWNSLLSKIS